MMSVQTVRGSEPLVFAVWVMQLLNHSVYIYICLYTCIAYIRAYVRTDVHTHTHTHTPLMRKRANKRTLI